jgi:hypothetical protein
MEENDSTSCERRKFTYLDLLQQINKLCDLTTGSNNSRRLIKETCDIPEIEKTFNHVAENITRISNEMPFQRGTMLLISVLNIILRLSALDGFGLMMSREPFRLMFEKVNDLILNIKKNKDLSPTCASDILDSMLLNLLKDDFLQTCFNRLLSNDTISNTSKILFLIYVQL